MSRLSDQVAIVTGSSSGIGEAVARRLAASGATVVVNSSRSVDAGRAVAESLPTDSIYLQADISEADQVRGLVAETVESFGRLDILVNNAGWTSRVPHSDLAGLTDQIFVKTFQVNVYGTWWLTKAAMPHLSQSPVGNVVTITSVAGLRPVGSSIAYSMSKAALNHMTRLLARACAPVRVNAVAPGLITTPWTEDWKEMHETIADLAPSGRSGSADEVAQAVLSLITNTYISGEVVVVDGGLMQVM